MGFIYVFRWLPGVHFTEQDYQAMFPSEFSRAAAASVRIHHKLSLAPQMDGLLNAPPALVGLTYRPPSPSSAASA